MIGQASPGAAVGDTIGCGLQCPGYITGGGDCGLTQAHKRIMQLECAHPYIERMPGFSISGASSRSVSGVFSSV